MHPARAGVVTAVFAQGTLLHTVGSLVVNLTRGLGKRLVVVFETPAILSRGGGSGEWRENAFLPILSDPLPQKRDLNILPKF